MKISTSSGDFSHYFNSVPDKVRCFKQTKFKYVNLEQTGIIPELFSENDDDWRRFADGCARAADDADVRFVISHAPCLHKAVLPALLDKSDEEYGRNVRAIRRSIEVCHALSIDGIVIHASTDASFDLDTFYRYNKMFYGEFLELAEKHGITVMTENWADDKTLFSTGRQMRDFIDFIDHPLFAACWDTAHGNIAASARTVGQYENVRALGEKLKGLHISDNFGDSHHHSWPFAGIINFDAVMQALIDVNYGGYFNFEASYTLLHHKNIPYHRQPFEYGDKTVTRLLDPPLHLKQRAVDLLYDIGEYILSSYGLFEE